MYNVGGEKGKPVMVHKMEKVVANPKEWLEEGVRGGGVNANSGEKVSNENLFVVQAEIQLAKWNFTTSFNSYYLLIIWMYLELNYI
jgi:hypothetical protein